MVLRAWIGRPSQSASTDALREQTAEDRRQAEILAAKADEASQSAALAMSAGEWSAAAECEERRVTIEDELARLRARPLAMTP